MSSVEIPIQVDMEVAESTQAVTMEVAEQIVVNPPSNVYTKLAETEVAASTTSTGVSIIKNIDISPASDVWSSAYQIFVRIRDKAGKRPGYFFGTDTIISNPLVGTSALAVAASAIARNTYTYTSDDQFAVSTQNAGVYVYDVSSAGRIRIGMRYNSAYSLTIDGTYKIEVYALPYPDNVSPFA